ncbi:MBL fold metallo-hydrolase, partial [Patescibacteria group bacterium]|nr:MBL fold metallo-hydrolase [Patescibacteria group bacterium]
MSQHLLKKLSLTIGVVLLIGWSVLSVRPSYSSVPALDVWMLNVGQGESVLLREPHDKKILFDGGPDETVLSQLGSILPVWDRKINLVILSHNHSDHIDGLISVLERYQISEVWLSG